MTPELLIDELRISEEMQRAVEAGLEAEREKALRDVFATAALGSIIARNGVKYHGGIGEQAELAYEYADAMLKARR